MLKRLRMRLALICTCMTGTILLIMVLGSLPGSEKQLKERSAKLFQSNFNAILFKLQSDSTISNTWLAQTEASNHLIIDIEDNGQPFSFSGSWFPPTPRHTLIAMAKEKAIAEHGITITTRPAVEVSYAVFEIHGERNERYMVAVSQLTLHNGWQTVTMVRDMSEEDASIIQQRVLVFGLVALGAGMLFVFSWWFAGRAIRPIAESQRRQVEFVAAASHELRSPLAVLRTSASALTIDPTNAKQFASTIEQECQRMAHLVDDLLLLAGLDAKTWPVHLEPLDCDTLLLELYERYLPVAEATGHFIGLDLPKGALPAIRGDKERLQQILSILIENALQHTPSGCRIVLHAHAQGAKLRIEVADNGPGIAPEHKQKLFERFYRIDKSRTDKTHFGLGLSIARELITLHNGSLILCDTPGGGATFVIDLFV